MLEVLGEDEVSAAPVATKVSEQALVHMNPLMNPLMDPGGENQALPAVSLTGEVAVLVSLLDEATERQS